MDTSRQVPEAMGAKNESANAAQRQHRSIAEKQRIVEETFPPIPKCDNAQFRNATMRRNERF